MMNNRPKHLPAAFSNNQCHNNKRRGVNGMSSRVLVLGIGNVLWADEGFGVRAVEAFHERFEGPDSMRVMDGGTQGIYLVPHIQDADLLVIFDAIDYGLPPGTLKLLQDDDVPQFMGAKKMSLHQTGFQEVLAMAELLGGGPRAMLLVGGAAASAGGLWRQPEPQCAGSAGAGPGLRGGLPAEPRRNAKAPLRRHPGRAGPGARQRRPPALRGPAPP